MNKIILWVHIWESEEFFFLALVLILRSFLKWWIIMKLSFDFSLKVVHILNFLLSIHFFISLLVLVFILKLIQNKWVFYEIVCFHQSSMKTHGVFLLQQDHVNLLRFTSVIVEWYILLLTIIESVMWKLFWRSFKL